MMTSGDAVSSFFSRTQMKESDSSVYGSSLAPGVRKAVNSCGTYT